LNNGIGTGGGQLLGPKHQEATTMSVAAVGGQVKIPTAIVGRNTATAGGRMNRSSLKFLATVLTRNGGLKPPSTFLARGGARHSFNAVADR
jgi:hypothetical protein